jgi:phosphatidylglycerol:prolipoprotein diacylglycerol transferase
MAQLMSLVLIAVGALGLWWLYGRRRPLPDPSGVAA